MKSSRKAGAFLVVAVAALFVPGYREAEGAASSPFLDVFFEFATQMQRRPRA
jgi:hypothetical protein